MNRVAIPAELLELDQWLVATPKKVPATVNGRGRIVAAAVNDRSKYLDYASARGAADDANELLTAAAYGVGFALTPEDCYCVVDIDIKDERNEPDVSKRTPKELRDTFMQVIDWLDSYTEHSRSGVGYHVWVKVPKHIADKLPNVKKPGIEVYFRDRYIVTTGDVVANKPIADRSTHIDALLRQFAPEKFVAVASIGDNGVRHVDVQDIDDEDVFERLFSLKNGKRYRDLRDGDWESYYETQSQADMALMEGLFFVTRNPERVIKIFLQSGLGVRDKARRPGYAKMTMDSVVRKVSEQGWFEDMVEEQVADVVAHPPVAVADIAGGDEVVSSAVGSVVGETAITSPVAVYEYDGELIDLSCFATSNDVVSHVIGVLAGTGADMAAEIARATGIWRAAKQGVGAAPVVDGPRPMLIDLPDQVPEIRERVADSDFDMKRQVVMLMNKNDVAHRDGNLAGFNGYDGSSVDIPYPPGVAGDMMRYLANSTAKGVKEVAIATGLAVLSGIAGKAWQIDGTGVNLYLAILGASGIGKTSIINSAQSMMKEVSLASPFAANVFSPSRVASMQALLRQAEKADSFILRIDEFGKMLNSAMSGRSAGDASVIAELINLFDKSGKDAVVQGVSYSNSEKNIQISRSIAVTVLGDSTPKGYYESLSADSSEDGFSSRFIQIEYTGKHLYTNYNRVTEVPDNVMNALATITSYADQQMRACNYINVTVSADVQSSLVKMDKDATDLINSGAIPDGQHYLYNRKALKIMKIASLLAILDNHLKPEVNIVHFDWALDLVNQINARQLYWIKQGMIAGTASSIEVEDVIVGRLRDYFSNPTGTTRDIAMAKKGALTSKKLRSIVECMPVVKKSNLGARDAATKIIKALEESGVIKHHTRHFAKKMFGAVSSTCYSYDPNMDDALHGGES